MKKQFYDVNTVGKTYLWTICMPVIVIFLSELILLSALKNTDTTIETLSQDLTFTIIFSMLTQVAFLIVCFIANKKTNVFAASKINFKLGLVNILLCVGIGILVNFGLGPIVNSFNIFLDWIGYELSADLPLVLDSFGMLALSVLLFALVPAIVEELLFRGVILQGLRKFGDKIAIVLSALMFALIHFAAEQFVLPFIFGMIMAYVVIKTGSILSSIIIHFTSNLVSLICIYFNFEYLVNMEPIWFVLLSILLLSVTILVVWLISKLFRNVEKNKSATEVLNVIENQQNISVNNSTFTLKASIAVAVVIWVLGFAYNIAGIA